MKKTKYVYTEYKSGEGLKKHPLEWNRGARDLEGVADRELLEELCRRVIDYNTTSIKFYDGERGTLDEILANDNNYCRVREVVRQVLGIDMEYVEEVGT